MLGNPQAQFEAARQMQGLASGGAGFGLGRTPLELDQVNARIDALQEQITELDRQVDVLQQLKTLMEANPKTTELLRLCQKAGML